MSQVDFNQNIVNFNQVGGGYDKVDIGNLGNSSIPGLSGSLSGQNEQMDFQLQAGGSDKYGAIKDANFQRHESVTAKGNFTVITKKHFVVD